MLLIYQILMGTPQFHFSIIKSKKR